MAEEEAAEVEAVSEGGSGYALMTDAWPTCVKVSSRIIRGIHKTPKCKIFGNSMVCYMGCLFGRPL